MQKIANENAQARANYSNKPAADKNATETMKYQIIEMKSAQPAANGKIPTSQGKSAIRDKIIKTIINDKEDGTTEKKINTKTKITNKEAYEADKT